MADVDLTYFEHAIRSRNYDVLRHTSDRRNIQPRTTEDTTTCHQLQPEDLIISRTTLIITLTSCGLLTLLSLLVLGTFTYKQHTRRLAMARAKSWGRQSRFYERDNKRISCASKGVDDEFTRRYRGVFCNAAVENPEMGSDEAVELELGLQGEVWEKDGGVGLPVVVDVDELQDVDLGGNGEEDGATSMRYEVVVDGRVRSKVPEQNTEGRKVKGGSLFWYEGEGGYGGIWMPKR